MNRIDAVNAEISTLADKIEYLSEAQARPYLEQDIAFFFELSFIEAGLKAWNTVYFLLNKKLFSYIVELDDKGQQKAVSFLWDKKKSLHELAGLVAVQLPLLPEFS